MKTNELYLAILNDIRYEVMSLHWEITLADFEPGSKGRALLTAFNDAASKLTSLINTMEYEEKLASGNPQTHA